MSGEMPLERRLVSEDLGHVVCLDRHPSQPISADEGLSTSSPTSAASRMTRRRGARTGPPESTAGSARMTISIRASSSRTGSLSPHRPAIHRPGADEGDRIAAFSCATFDGAVMWVPVSPSPQLPHLAGRISTTGLSTPRGAMSTGVQQPIEGKLASAKRLVCPCHGWVVQNDALSTKLPQRPMTHARWSLPTRVIQRTG